MEFSGYVYFVQDRHDGLIKIGSTGQCPYVRLQTLRSEARRMRDRYSCLELLGSYPVDDKRSYYRDEEKALHLRFASLREDGEWFRPGQELWREIYQSARPHFCLPECGPGAPMVWEVEEERRKRADRSAQEAMRRVAALR